MEITLLIEAMDTSFSIMEKANKKAVGLLDTAVKLTSETRSVEERNIRDILEGAQKSKSVFGNFVATFLILFAFWLVLSGKYDLFHLSLGLVCAAFVAFFSHDLLFANTRVGDMRVIAKRFVMYAVWLLGQIAISNIHVAAAVFSSKKRITPRIVTFKTKLESDISWITLANSITLTPGTITMDIRDGEFMIHALNEKVARDLDAGEMEDRVAHVYMEADHMYVQDVLDVAPIFGELRK
ncbi:conserved membrane hypothetical protein [Candidatus Desulfarcum epimagneticum]|uniref:Cation:proton antiporter n=1 Tax=uncultured Desulfobacteraceae bacterium TaxID=218296 RepID=A0A484HL22_9BACT|nr:conserved membrane hypothetical protein [uncultured Desulfobacteraceae bacterium]